MDNLDQMRIAGCKQGIPLGFREFIGGKVFTALFHKNQGTVIGYVVMFKKILGRTKMFLHQAPQTPPTDFTPSAVKSVNWFFRMDFFRLSNLCLNLHPFAHKLYFPKGNAGLSHSPWTRVHTDQ